MPPTTNQQIAAYASLAELLQLLGDAPAYGGLGAALVSSDELPPAFKTLLNHEEHMTARLGQFHGSPVALTVLRHHRADGVYVREILLTRADTGRPVEYGIVRLHERFLDEQVLSEILKHRRPLGDILIAYGVHRRIEPRWFFRFDEQSVPSQRLGGGPVYGRVGTIHCSGEAAIELLEAVRE